MICCKNFDCTQPLTSAFLLENLYMLENGYLSPSPFPAKEEKKDYREIRITWDPIRPSNRLGNKQPVIQPPAYEQM